MLRWQRLLRLGVVSRPWVPIVQLCADTTLYTCNYSASPGGGRPRLFRWCGWLGCWGGVKAESVIRGLAKKLRLKGRPLNSLGMASPAITMGPGITREGDEICVDTVLSCPSSFSQLVWILQFAGRMKYWVFLPVLSWVAIHGSYSWVFPRNFITRLRLSLNCFHFRSTGFSSNWVTIKHLS